MPLSGLHQEVPAPGTSASKLINFTVDAPTQGWDNRIGYEKYFVGEDTLYAPFSSLGRIDSLFVWPKHAGALEYILFETGGTLYFLQDWSSISSIRALDSDRNIPTSSEVPSTYTPFGKWLVILNGHNAPIRYSGWDHEAVQAYYPVRGLGWTGAPPPPLAWDVDVDPSTNSAQAGQVIGIWASGGGEYGLGSSTSDAPNGYKWRVTFLSDAGGESPISAASNAVEWVTPSAGDWANHRFIVGMSLPVGPAGTLARNVYRTKNLGDNDLGSGEEQEYFYVATIRNNTETFYYDHWSDNQLGSAALTEADSLPFPAPSARYSCTYKGCLLVDGGASQGTRFYWSLPGKPDQYKSLDYADVGSRAGGEITGFYAHYNFVLIFRDRAVDLFYGTYGKFEVRPLMQGIGTRASQTARAVPELGGVVFLADDGAYLVSGSVDGGGTVSVTKLSASVQDEVDRMNLDVSARATAEYSSLWREYHVYFPADGEDRNSLGLVFHLDKKAWSTRVDYPVGCLAVNMNGDFIFGHHTGYTGVTGDPAGLFVLSRRHACGHEYVETVNGENQSTFTTVYASPCPSTYRSAWQDFGNPEEKKQVLYLYLYAYTMGNDPITVTVLKDYSSTGVDAPAIRLQRADWADQEVMGTAQVATSYWEEERVSCFRIDVNSALTRTQGQGGNACSWWAFEVVTTADFVLFGYALEAKPSQAATILPAKRAL